ncbi:MAG: lysylphosphatidylglycerol synthase transmembrane domain-containing protein [Pseudomonadales bacterium]
MAASLRRWAMPLLRWVGTLTLLLLIFRSVDFAEFRSALAQALWPYLALAALTLIVQRLLMAHRLQQVTKLFDDPPSYHDSIAMILTSSLAGFALPGGIATDVVRGYQLNSLIKNPGNAISAVLLDRFFGILAILCIGAMAGMLAGSELAAQYRWFPLASLALLVFGLLLARPLMSLLEATVIGSVSAVKKLFSFTDALLRGLALNRQTAYLFAISLTIQLSRCLIFFWLFFAMSVPVSPSHVFVFVPVMFILIMVPVSVGGLGVREGILVLMFAPMGVEIEKLILIGFASHLLEFLTTLPGGWYLLRGLPSRRSSDH